MNWYAEKPFNLNEAAVKWVESVFEKMTAVQKISQLLIPVCSDLSHENLDRLLDCGAGALYFFGGDIHELREAALYLQHKAEIPLLICGDMEPAFCSLMKNSIPFPCQMAVAAADDPAIAADIAMSASLEYRYAGFNWVFSPDADVNINFRNPAVNVRSFGDSIETVSRLSLLYASGIHQTGMAACAKHWPGDGVDERDQHFVTSCNSLGMQAWLDCYGVIYSQLIDSGIRTIMAGHISFPAYVSEQDAVRLPKGSLPASISPLLNRELLRERMKFNGLIVSDASSMAGLTSAAPRNIFIPMLIENGCDMVLFPENPELDASYMHHGLERGILSAKRLEEAVLRILALKASLGLNEKCRSGKDTDETVSSVFSRRQEHFIETVRTCCEKSVTLVKDTQELLPLHPLRHGRILLIHPAEDPSDGPLIMGRLLEENGFEVTVYSESTFIDSDLYDAAIYVLYGDDMIFRREMKIDWMKLHRTAAMSMFRFWHYIPTAAVSLGNPFYLHDMPDCKTYVNAYSSIEPMQRAVVEILLGRIKFSGKSPVDPFCGLTEAGF